ncbi:hypothetical protein HPB47_010861 [Ixodes persulcatus]|uniref:Uncharacterized protein n=1 Tax=Ixodes persulcatus TaxID=34615 RepID=A0AC60NXY6_IXOPE|nr:hypothetical protein HPB47_010861 [Ixodes persulcatus]
MKRSTAKAEARERLETRFESCSAACPRGSYGRNCSERCECAPNALCDVMSGACTCGPGWRGSFCELPCPPGFHGTDCGLRCDCRAGVDCNAVTGQCLDSVNGTAGTPGELG